MTISLIPKFGTAENEDITYTNLGHSSESPDFATTLSIAPDQINNFIDFGTLTDALTINADTTSSSKFDRLTLIFLDDGSGRIITFGTDLNVTGTLTLTASGKASIEFLCDGLEWIETNRTIL